MNLTIELEEWQISRHSLLFCPHCGTWTNHALSTSRAFYACSCGLNFIDIEIIEKEIENVTN